MSRHTRQHPGRCTGSVTCKNCQIVRDRELAAMAHPPEGDSWVDYATRHQHVGVSCWQCVAREKALDVHNAMLAALERVERSMRSGQWEKVEDVRQEVRAAIALARGGEGA